MRAALCRRCLCKQLHAHGRGCSASFARCGMCANACRLLGSPASVCGSAQLSSGCPCGFSLPPRFFGVFFFFPFELWSGCSSFFLPDLSFWQLASSRSGVCSVFFTKAASYGGGGSEGAQRMRVRCRTHQRAGLRVLGALWDKTSPSTHWVQRPCSACARRGAPVFGGRSWKVPELLGSSFWTVLGRVWICSVDC